MKRIAGFFALAALAGCAMQEPAPLVSGYNGGAQRMEDTAAARNFSQVEPAAGPRTVSAQSAQTPQVVADNLGPVTATKATLPPPSVIGDMKNYATGAKGWQSYTVQQGDTVFRLAREFNTNSDEILKANGMRSAADISTGQTLVIPAGIGRFGKAETLAARPAAPAQVASVAPAVAEPIQPVAQQAEARPPVVTGPNGTRYSLTRHEEVAAKTGVGVPQQNLARANSPVLADEAMAANVEPAAGPSAQDVKAQLANAASGKVAYLEHRVDAGETVYRIAQKYHASVIDIMNANDFTQPQQLKSGTVVKVPVPAGHDAAAIANGKPLLLKDEPEGAPEVATVKPALNPSAATEMQAELQRGRIDPVAARAKGMVWPVKGQVSSAFGNQGPGVTNSGIVIKVPANTPVMAVDDGEVVYADKGLKTYGNLVLLRHKNGLVTAYGHNSALLVKKGEAVKKGQIIALSGNSGNVKDPQLHFEIRQNARAIDPLAMLPSR